MKYGEIHIPLLLWLKIGDDREIRYSTTGALIQGGLMLFFVEFLIEVKGQISGRRKAVSIILRR